MSLLLLSFCLALDPLGLCALLCQSSLPPVLHVGRLLLRRRTQPDGWRTDPLVHHPVPDVQLRAEDQWSWLGLREEGRGQWRHDCAVDSEECHGLHHLLLDKIFEKVINPYLTEVLKHPQSIKMSEGMLHIRDVDGPKKTESVEMWLEAMEQQVIKCQGMVERGLNANHTMITEFTSNHNMDAIDIGKHLSKLYDRVDQLQGQIYDLQNQNWNI
ncbi:40S ribosomal protein S5-1 [Hordeum vulgare]|nr:40S ribosomal protein S5-1 [Hordeum vulgare]